MLNKNRLLTPGPTMLPERVRLAMAHDMMHHRKPGFKALLADLQPRLQALFGTSQTVLPLACSGTGAMTAAVHNLFAPGESVLVVEGGKFGQRWKEIALARGLTVIDLQIPWGKAVTLEQVETALRAHPEIRGLLVQISETSTGVMHPVDKLGALTSAHEVLLVADGISSVGVSPVHMDEWNIDCLVTGSQKGLMVPPGLALVALSANAWSRTTHVRPQCYYLDLAAERDMQKNRGETHFTPAISLVYGLHASLQLIEEHGGFDEIFRKQWALTMLTRTGIRTMGLEPFAPTNFTWGLTSVALPAGVDGVKLLRLAREQWGVTMEGGQDHLKGKIVRIGHMGWVDWADILAGLHALAWALHRSGGFMTSRHYLEKAVEAYAQALTVRPGTPVVLL